MRETRIKRERDREGDKERDRETESQREGETEKKIWDRVTERNREIRN